MTSMRARSGRLTGWPAVFAWLVVVAGLAAMIACFVLIPEQVGADKITLLIGTLMVASFGLVGAFLVTRLPRNPVGWILWGASVVFAVTIAAQDYASFSVTAHDSGLPGTVFFAWLSGIGFVSTLAVVVIFVPLLFPDGHLLSRRWRWLVAFSIALVMPGIIQGAFQPGPLVNFPTIRNPVGVELTGSLGDLVGLVHALDLVGLASVLGVVVAFPLAVASSILRYRRGSKVERLQLRWFAAACGVTTACFLLSATPAGPLSDIGWMGAFSSISLIPVAIGIAITRYRLYEIDRIVSRTLSYAAVTAVLVAVFAGAILLFQAVLAPVTGGNTVAVAASTLVVAALFQPLRRRIQSVVDRRFNRSRYDAEGTVAAFAGRLRDEVDLEMIRADLLRTAGAAVRPASAGTWLRTGGGSR